MHLQVTIAFDEKRKNFPKLFFKKFVRGVAFSEFYKSLIYSHVLHNDVLVHHGQHI